MIRSLPGRFILVAALIALVLGSAGCAPTSTSTPAIVATAPVATTAAAQVATAATTPQARPSTTPERRPTATRATGGLAIATPLPGDRMLIVRVDRLPPEAHDTIRLIAAGGPFPYRQDGVVFENREKLLPAKATGYYHEYTVVTPGSPDRGARRLIRGGQDELYYTDDHYDSFRRVTP
jgi:ribonuclease T1